MIAKISKTFFQRRTLQVARDLLGKFVVRKIGGKKIALMITETEGYVGAKDLASHARFGRTKRNEVMYGAAGHWYVYLVYGMHYLLNVVTERKNYPAAVLIRSGKIAAGVNLATKNLGQRKLSTSQIIGPGKLTKALVINKEFYGKSAVAGHLYIEDRGFKISASQIKNMPRVGIDYAGKWKDKKWRFKLELKRYANLNIKSFYSR